MRGDRLPREGRSDVLRGLHDGLGDALPVRPADEDAVRGLHALAVPLLVRLEVGGQRLLERGLLALEPLWGHSPQWIFIYFTNGKND